jgi:hypothetical protein
MASTQIEISNIEINPNRLPDYTKVPLPDFAISALKRNGLLYEQKQTNNGEFKHDLQSSERQSGCKLSEHIRAIKTHIDSDGTRHWGRRSVGVHGTEHDSQSAASSSANDTI